jgi:hypothetical protein
MGDMYDIDHLSMHPGDDAYPQSGHDAYPDVVEQDLSGDGVTDYISVTIADGEVQIIKDTDADGEGDLYLLDQDGDGVAEIAVQRHGEGYYVFENTDGDGNLDRDERTSSPTQANSDVWTRADLDRDARFIGLVDVLDQAFNA